MILAGKFGKLTHPETGRVFGGLFLWNLTFQNGLYRGRAEMFFITTEEIPSDIIFRLFGETGKTTIGCLVGKGESQTSLIEKERGRLHRGRLEFVIYSILDYDADAVKDELHF